MITGCAVGLHGQATDWLRLCRLSSGQGPFRKALSTGEVPVLARNVKEQTHGIPVAF